MKVSRRVKRMQKLRKRSAPAALNLVSLMDVFTVLVFFLLVNTSASPELPSSKDLKLPQSFSENVPEETVTIAVTLEHILVQGVSVASVVEVQQSGEEIIEALKEELLFAVEGHGRESQRVVTIAGHEDIDYELVRKLLKTCQDADFNHVAFAAQQIQRSQALARD